MKGGQDTSPHDPKSTPRFGALRRALSRAAGSSPSRSGPCDPPLPLVRLVIAPLVTPLVAASFIACSPRDAGSAGSSGLGLAAPSIAPPPVPSVSPEVSSASLEGPTARVTSSAAPALGSPPEGMALVPAGPFTMGADGVGEPDERPAHAVTLPAFYLDLTEVSNEAWDRCVAAAACTPPDVTSAGRNGFGADTRFRTPHQPVSAVSWDGARAYCAWLGKRLPGEAEWEKAARGTDGRRYPWGNAEPTPDRAVFSGGGVTADVGTHPRGDGPYGHHDLAGNVWEWVEDVYDPYAYARPGAAQGKGGSCEESMAALDELRQSGKKGFTGSNPIPTECEHVLRGGAFNYPGPGLRSSNRVHHPGRFRLVMSGFRCARDAAPGGASPP
jgi:formylglycine-generating enzyme required for sulfatase activity